MAENVETSDGLENLIRHQADRIGQLENHIENIR